MKYILVVISISICGLLSYTVFGLDTSLPDAPTLQVRNNTASLSRALRGSESAHVLFVGDVMLGRGVETLIGEHGLAYPLRNVEREVQAADLAVVNFEGIVSEEHVHAPSMTFQFSIRDEYLDMLRTHGFDIFSLANNHSFDYGADALRYTRNLCESLGIVCGGTPRGIDTYSTHTREIHGTTLGFLFFQTVHGTVPQAELAEAFLRITEADVRIAYIHWGNEYELTHSKEQEVLAHALIDMGFDAIIGHHPHVAQDIELYKGKLIAYSLGNFVFDQYFSHDVQEGVALRMDISEDELLYTFLPHTSSSTKSQPTWQKGVDRTRMLERIFSSLQGKQGVDIVSGTIAQKR